ncbi:MAG TPA: hypothetical protein VFR18_12190 [Terriglobia bacterium]|nr:hypothetical protein [Terriglobia bacterium]
MSQRLKMVYIAICCVASVSAAFAQSISWTPDRLTVSVGQSERVEIPVAVSADESVGAVDVRVVPALEGLVRVEPTSLQLVAGRVEKITVSINADATQPLGVKSGVVQLRAGKNLSRPLPIAIDIVQGGRVAAGDLDGNGVWDYIDLYVNGSFPGVVNGPTRSAARQYARALEGALLNAADRATAVRFALDSDRATECMFHVRPQDAARVLADLAAVVANSQVRSRALLDWSELTSGEVYDSVPLAQRVTSCRPD